MGHYDTFEKAMEILGFFFRKILSKIMLLKENGATDLQVAEIGDLMKSGIGLNLYDIESLTNEAFLTYLLDKKLKTKDISNMINILVELGTLKNSLPSKFNANQLLNKALYLSDYLTATKKLVYFENIAALDEAKRLLK